MWFAASHLRPFLLLSILAIPTMARAVGAQPSVISAKRASVDAVKLTTVQLKIQHVPSTQAYDLRFRHLTTESGLSNRNVHSAAQDSTGFMWLATDAGLDRFDGYGFKTFKHVRGQADSLACVNVRMVIRDDSGEIWAACDHSLEHFDRRTETFRHFPLPPSAADNQGVIITSMTQNPDRTFWVTSHSGLFRFDPQSGELQRFKHSAEDPASLNSNLADFIVRDSPHTIWVAAAKELNHLDESSGKVIEHVTFSEPHTIIGMHVDHEGTIWVARSHEDCPIATMSLTARTLTCLQPSNAAGHNIMRSGNQAMMETPDGAMWFGTQVDGLVRYDFATHHFTQYLNRIQDPSSVAGNNVSSLFQDSSGNMWTALQTGGIDLFSPIRPKLLSLTREHGDLLSNLVTAAFEDTRGILWIASYGGLNRIDRAAQSNIIPSGPGVLGELSAFAEDKQHRLLAGTFREGIQVIDPKTGTYKPWLKDLSRDKTSSHPITRLVFDRSGQLWAAARSGLELIDQTSGATSLFTPDGSYVEFTDLKLAKDGTFWLSSNAGLYHFLPSSKQFIGYKHADDNAKSISNDETSFVHLDEEGYVWVATHDGLSRLDPAAGTFLVFRAENGLAGDVVDCLLEDHRKRLWISTDRGLSRLDLKTMTLQSVPLVNGAAALDLSGRSACYESGEGEMIFGGYSGAVVFHPDDLPDTPATLRVALTDFELSGRSVSPGRDSVLPESITYVKRLELKHDQNAFALAFAALNASSNAGIRYRYKLEGLDKDWNVAASAERVAAYTSIPPGRYRFTVQAASSILMWNGPVATLEITVRPPWWSTWWFETLYTSAAVLSVWVLYRRRMLIVYREATVRSTERAEERTRVARELHDTLMQTVEGCRIMAETAFTTSVAGATKSEVIGQLAEWLRRASDEGRVAMQTLRPPADPTRDLQSDVARFAEELGAQGTPLIQLRGSDSGRRFWPGVREEVFRIVTEAIRNACQHSRASQITVEFFQEHDLVIAIEDDGIGIPQSVLETGKAKHYGLQGMKERAAKIGGSVRVSNLQRGTKVLVTIPEHAAFCGPDQLGRLLQKWGLQHPA